jgi:hypothetical protein
MSKGQGTQQEKLPRACYALTEGGIFLIRPPGQNPARKIRVLTELLIEHFG